ncbi:hypothetical protein FD37_GL001630 [Levilactobacillus spicheri DSM 15429]|uniref:Uncharacterized protein n=1 Tax=Levilactobacillus spicheri DSM 15429 TaxID=1423805 RepID=A0A0R1QU41_9LACO|nr:hypothetical protein FD37_GL001630 [Levilactobacillus spicheri DSM 15429]
MQKYLTNLFIKRAIGRAMTADFAGAMTGEAIQMKAVSLDTIRLPPVSSLWGK